MVSGPLTDVPRRPSPPPASPTSRVLIGLLVLVIVTAAVVSIGALVRPDRPSLDLDLPYTADVGAEARQYYVSPSGSDAAEGSRDEPWRTLAHALTRIEPGAVLNLREGVYFENGLDIRIPPGEGSPTVIRSFPGERAVIDGGMADFRRPTGDRWQVVDDTVALFRSADRYRGEFVRARLLETGRQLVEYESLENLSSTNYGPVRGTEPLYIGPGLMLGEDGHIYIRLEANPNDLLDFRQQPLESLPSSTDPNEHGIAVYTSETIFTLAETGNLQFRDLTLANSERMLDIESGSHQIAVLDSTLEFGSYGLVVRDHVGEVTVAGNRFDNGFPNYVYWTDVKNLDEESAEAYPEFQSTAIQGRLDRFTIERNRFVDGFDGLQLDGGSKDTVVRDNQFLRLRDDAINLSRGIADVEVDHNVLWNVGAGISNLSSSDPPGHVYIHHNIIDNSIPQRGGREGNHRAENWPVWTVIDPFASHDDGDKDSWWKLYNNTIVTRRGGDDWNGAGPTPVDGNAELYVHNNIFYVIDDRVVFRDHQAASASNYDGNIVFQAEPGRFPLLLNFGDGNDYTSLADFRERSGTGWELHGLQVDPGFDRCRLSDPPTTDAELRARYRPSNPEVLTPGAPPVAAWPGADGVDYRGAITERAEDAADLESAC